MIDVKEKIKENQRKQRKVVDAFQKKISEETVPYLSKENRPQQMC